MGDEVVTTPFGKFLVNPAECIGATVKAGTVWDGPGFLQVIAREHGCLGEPGVTILDVGAHLGDWTVWLVGQGAWRVVAVEPAPQRLKANLDLNRDVCAERVIVVPQAAWHTRADLHWTKYWTDQDSGGAALTPVYTRFDRVSAVDLDAYLPLYGDRVSLIKIDVQGSEGEVLQGLAQTIDRDHPVIVFEWEAGPVEPITHALRAQEYRIVAWPSHPNNYVALPTRRIHD